MNIINEAYRTFCTGVLTTAVAIGSALYFTGHLKVIPFTDHMWAVTLY